MLFDTQKLHKALTTAGLQPDAAEAVLEALKDAHLYLVTKDELAMSETKLENRITEALHKQTVYIIGAIFAAIGATATIVHLMK